MERVLVIGSGGAGKSTLARRLAARTGLPLLHLDAEYWQAGWVEPATDCWLARVDEIVASPRWIIDGNYGGSLPARLARADTVVWLDYPTRTCLLRAAGRVLANRGRVRPDMAEGCPEHFDLDFFVFIATFRRRVRPRLIRKLQSFEGKLVRLSRPHATERWFSAL